MSSQYPPYPVPSASAMVLHQNKVLLLQRRFAPGQGQWSFPGGKIELGETAARAAVREVAEESGIAIATTKLLDVVDVIIPDAQQKTQYHYIIAVYQGRYLSGAPTNSPESYQVCWVPLGEALNYELTGTARQIIAGYQPD